MNAPSAELMALYGTDAYYLEKAGAITPGQLKALQVAAPLAFLGIAASDKARRARLLAEAAVMNQMFRAVEAQRMQAMKEGFKGASIDSELVKVAEAIGRRLAHQANDELAMLMEKAASGAELSEMEKEALVGLLGKGLGLLGRGMGSAGKALGWGSTGAVGRGGLSQTIGGKMRQWGAGMRGTGLQMRGVKPATGEGMLSGLKKAITPGWKTKALGAGALALGGYGAFKGLQAARDYMMTPTSQERWGRHGVAPVHQVGPYGYVTPTM